MCKILTLGIFSQRDGINDNAGESILIFFYIGQCFCTDICCYIDCLILLITLQIHGIADTQCAADQVVGQTLWQTEVISQIIQCFQRTVIQFFAFHSHTFFPAFFTVFVAVELEGVGCFCIQRQFIDDFFAEVCQFHGKGQGHQVSVIAQAEGNVSAFLGCVEVSGRLIFFIQPVQTFFCSHIPLFLFQTDIVFPAFFSGFLFFLGAVKGEAIRCFSGDGQGIYFCFAFFPEGSGQRIGQFLSFLFVEFQRHTAVYLYTVGNFVNCKGSAVSVVDGTTGCCYGQFLGNAGGDGFLIFRTMDDLQAEQPENDDRKEDDDAAEHNKYSVFTKI